MALDQNYYELWFESFEIESISGHKDPIQIHLVPGQQMPPEIAKECSFRSVDPFSLLTECSKGLLYNYPLGTKFYLKVKLTDRESGGLFFYTFYKWAPLKVVKPGATVEF